MASGERWLHRFGCTACFYVQHRVRGHHYRFWFGRLHSMGRTTHHLICLLDDGWRMFRFNLGWYQDLPLPDSDDDASQTDDEVDSPIRRICSTLQSTSCERRYRALIGSIWFDVLYYDYLNRWRFECDGIGPNHQYLWCCDGSC